MAIAVRTSRLGMPSALNWRSLRQRLMPLLLLAFFCEVTLPYQADCPLYHAGHCVTKAAVTASYAADVDKAALFHPASTGTKDTGKDKKPTTETCSLCALNASFVGAVAAGLIALPPPPLYTADFTYVDTHEPELPAQRGFSARAPPIVV